MKLARKAYPYRCKFAGLSGPSFAAAKITGLALATPLAPPAKHKQPSSPPATSITQADFDPTNGIAPLSVLVKGTDGNLYRMTHTSAAIKSELLSRPGIRFGEEPLMTTNTRMKRRRWFAYGCASLLFCTGSVTNSAGQTPTFTVLAAFTGTNGEQPRSLAQGTDGNFYGVTSLGGGGQCNDSIGCGTVFNVTPAGTLTTLYTFGGSGNPAGPQGLILGTNGNFYGTYLTSSSGSAPVCPANGLGGVFRITSAGTFTNLYTFPTSGTGPQCPFAGVIEGRDGKLYGVSSQGGGSTACDPFAGCGTVFNLDGSGLTTLHGFSFTDGAAPSAPLTQISSGEFYGTTSSGGNTISSCQYLLYSYGGCGTVFKLVSSNDSFTLTTLHSFSFTDGAFPQAPLIQIEDGRVFGATTYGGSTSGCGGTPCGTIFRIGTSFTTLYSFNQSDGQDPSWLVEGTDGNLYGTTLKGGTYGNGTVFEISPDGVLTTLHDLTDSEGAGPVFIVQGTDGDFYGTTIFNNSSNAGIIFRLSVGLGPFVKTVPTVGEVGQSIRILGTNLMGATGVTFNGVAATYTVVSATEITATVPTGATTGTVQVAGTASGTLNSFPAFQVLQ